MCNMSAFTGLHALLQAAVVLESIPDQVIRLLIDACSVISTYIEPLTSNTKRIRFGLVPDQYRPLIF